MILILLLSVLVVKDLFQNVVNFFLFAVRFLFAFCVDLEKFFPLLDTTETTHRKIFVMFWLSEGI